MTVVNFRAIYVSDKQKFQVEISGTDGHQVKMMTEARFKRFIDDLDTEIEVGGVEVKFDGGDSTALQVVKDCSRKVYQSFLEARRRGQV
jgi:hypothetical protein